MENAEEIRIRIGQQTEVLIDNIPTFINYVPTHEDIIQIMQKACNYSLYAYDKEISQGFITLQGGHRIGFVGRAIYENNQLISIDNFNALNIRLAKQIANADEFILPHITYNGKFCSSLIISPPGIGKTTLLRELTKHLSDGTPINRSYKICLIDERNEISACVNGTPQFDVGKRTDIFYSIDKSEGIMISIRSMSPEIIVTDEISTEADIYTIKKALLSGVKVLASAHGDSIKDIFEKLPQITTINAFEKYVLIQRNGNVVNPLIIYNRQEVTNDK